MSKAREGGSKEWAKHLRKEGKRANNKGERRAAKKNIRNWS
jgi:hypothetical protein